MPVVINSPEEWFRTKRCDLYVIEYCHDDNNQPVRDSAYIQDLQSLHDWFDERLPDTELKIVGPSKYWRGIIDNPGYLSADFDTLTLALFQAAWDQQSKWAVKTLFFSEWRKRIEAAPLLTAPVPQLEKMLWWDSPRGILMLGATTEESNGIKTIYPDFEDGWWLLQQFYPELSEFNASYFASGLLLPSENDPHQVDIMVNSICNECWDGETYINDPQNLQWLREVIGIPENIRIRKKVWKMG